MILPEMIEPGSMALSDCWPTARAGALPTGALLPMAASLESGGATTAPALAAGAVWAPAVSTSTEPISAPWAQTAVETAVRLSARARTETPARNCANDVEKEVLSIKPPRLSSKFHRNARGLNHRRLRRCL